MNLQPLVIKNVNKRFESVIALANFTCSVGKGEIVGLIGPNGAGKTTLFNIICGYENSDSGDVLLNGVSVLGRRPYQIATAGISRTFQTLRLIRQISVLDNVMLAFRRQPGENLVDIFFGWPRCSRVEAANRNEAMKLLHSVRLDDKANARAKELSFGQQKLLSIVCALAAKGDILLLDEPVAGISPDLIDPILSAVRDYARAGNSVFVIEHNLDAVTVLCDRVIVLAAGKKVSEGPPSELRNDPRVIESYLGPNNAA